MLAQEMYCWQLQGLVTCRTFSGLKYCHTRVELLNLGPDGGCILLVLFDHFLVFVHGHLLRLKRAKQVVPNNPQGGGRAGGECAHHEEG